MVEQQFRELLESVLDAMVIINQENKVVLVNSHAENIFGYGRNELLGQPIAILMPERFRNVYLGQVKQTFTESCARSIVELYALRKDGTEFPVEISLSPIHMEEGLAVSSAIRDITACKREEPRHLVMADELSCSREEFEQFASIVSHDLHEPLRGVVGCLQILEKTYKDKLDDRADELIKHAVSGAVRMRTLIDALFLLSRVISKPMIYEPIDLSDTLDQALKALSVSIKELGAIITHDALPVVVADRTQLVQLFQNLIDNAIKFCGTKPPEVHIGAKCQGDQWLLSVCDNGIGFEPEYAERIFKPFKRLHSRDKYPGTGIGLAICQRIVEQHEGTIWAESEPGKGTTFYCIIANQERKL